MEYCVLYSVNAIEALHSTELRPPQTCKDGCGPNIADMIQIQLMPITVLLEYLDFFHYTLSNWSFCSEKVLTEQAVYWV